MQSNSALIPGGGTITAASSLEEIIETITNCSYTKAMSWESAEDFFPGASCAWDRDCPNNPVRMIRIALNNKTNLMVLVAETNDLWSPLLYDVSSECWIDDPTWPTPEEAADLIADHLS